MDREYELQTHRAEDRHWWYRGRRQVLERVIAGLRLPARARILDAGCGSGRNMVELARHGDVTGVELSPTSVGLARERNAGEVIAGSVLDMPLESDSFDLAVCLDVIEHLADDVGALRELRRVAKRVLVTVPTGERELLPEQSVYEPTEWVDRFARAGFLVYEDELYELTGEGWRSVPELTPGLRYGERGPGASAVLCAELHPSSVNERVRLAVRDRRHRGEVRRVTS